MPRYGAKKVETKEDATSSDEAERIEALEREVEELQRKLRRTCGLPAQPRYRAVDRLHAVVTGTPGLRRMYSVARRVLASRLDRGPREPSGRLSRNSDNSPLPAVSDDKPRGEATAPAGTAPEPRKRAAYFERERYFEAVVEATDNFSTVTWLGHPIGENVWDLWVIQEVISEVRPSLLIQTGNRSSSALFYGHLFSLMGDGRVVTIAADRTREFSHPRVEFLLGSSTSPDVLEHVRSCAKESAGPVMVILEGAHDRQHVLAEMEAYAPLVTPASYMLVQDGGVDVLPVYASARPGPLPAIQEFLARHPEFWVDQDRDAPFLVTCHPRGWLRKKGALPSRTRPSSLGAADAADDRGERAPEAKELATARLDPRSRLNEVSEELREFVLELPFERGPIFDFMLASSESLAPGSRLADVGAGDAPYRELFEHVDYVAVDWEHSIHPGARHADVSASAESLPLEDQSFDAVLCTQVLEHLANPSEGLAEMRRILRPGGMLFLTAPLTWEVHEAPFDFYRYTDQGLRHLLEGVGFGDIRIEPRNDCFATLAQHLASAEHIMGRADDPLDPQREEARELLVGLARQVAALPPGLDLRRSFPLGYQVSACRPLGDMR